MSFMKKLEIFGLMLLGVLFFVWPMPHTVSVRDLLLVLSLCLFGYLAWQRGWPRQSFRALLLPASALTALTAWMYLVAFFISPETSWSLDEISSQWIRALLALLAGVLVAIAVKKESGLVQKTLFVIFVVLMLHILYVDLEALNIWLHDQNLERLAGLTEGPDKSNYLTNLLFCFLLTESFSRIFHKKRTLPFGNGILTAASALAVISVIVERTRNGIIVLVLMLLALGALYLVEQRKRLKKTAIMGGVAVMLLIVLGGLGLVAIARQSSSLNNLIATVPIAWDTEHYKPLPCPIACHARASCAEGFSWKLWRRVSWSQAAAPASRRSISKPWSAAGSSPTAEVSLVRPPIQSHIGKRWIHPAFSAVLSSSLPAPVIATAWRRKSSPAFW